jgi:predicted GNAT family N-acyltransferase
MNARFTLKEPIEPVTFAEQIEVTVARTLDDLLQMAAIRAVVYIGEQQCPFGEEFDGNDFNGATHLIARAGREPMGVMRIRWFADFAKIERFAVLSGRRGGRAARALFAKAYEVAERKGYRLALAYIQARLAPFMCRVGGATIREGRPRFVVSDHEYIEVERKLTPPPDALTMNSDPLVLLRPEGVWDRPGVLDRSTSRPATNPH